MTDNTKISRIEYLEKQIEIFNQDLALIEECDVKPNEPEFENVLYVWGKTQKILEKLVDERDMLRREDR